MIGWLLTHPLQNLEACLEGHLYIENQESRKGISQVAGLLHGAGQPRDRLSAIANDVVSVRQIRGSKGVLEQYSIVGIVLSDKYERCVIVLNGHNTRLLVLWLLTIGQI